MPGAQALTGSRVASTQQPAANNTASKDTGTSGRIRLHITPFNPTLLKTIVPPSLLPSATNISYHTVQTFPEKGYGYVELPTMEAQQLKKKLNGSILKGTKVRIEDARPEKRKAGDPAAEADGVEEGAAEKSIKRRKKQKKEEGVIPGFELPEGRKVKRGWTEPAEKVKKKSKDKDKKQKTEVSKYSKEPEMLFKTVVPPNKAEIKLAKKEKSKDQSRKSGRGKKPVTVHELEKTMKYATFLKDSQASKDGKMVAEYVEGKGWVDAQGSVVEPQNERRSKRKRQALINGEVEVPSAKMKASKKSAKRPPIGPESRDAQESAAAEEQERVSEDTPMDETIDAPAKAITERPRKIKEADVAQKVDDQDDNNDSDDSSSVVSSSSSDVSSSSSEPGSEVSSPSDVEKANEVADPPETATPTAKPNAASPAREVHPLEALFKRPKTPGKEGAPKPAPINTSFSFFDADAAEEDEDSTAVNQPMTPFTRRDLDHRGLRSAAPTPDTAAIGRRIRVPWKDDDDEEDEEQDDEESTSVPEGDANTTPLGTKRGEAQKADVEEKPESDFAKWFWEHRGETNRAWKRRRREVMKAKRQRENRRLGRRIV